MPECLAYGMMRIARGNLPEATAEAGTFTVACAEVSIAWDSGSYGLRVCCVRLSRIYEPARTAKVKRHRRNILCCRASDLEAGEQRQSAMLMPSGLKQSLQAHGKRRSTFRFINHCPDPSQNSQSKPERSCIGLLAEGVASKPA